MRFTHRHIPKAPSAYIVSDAWVKVQLPVIADRQASAAPVQEDPATIHHIATVCHVWRLLADAARKQKASGRKKPQSRNAHFVGILLIKIDMID